MHILNRDDTEVEYRDDFFLFESFCRGKALYKRGVKEMSIDGRFLTMIEINDLLTYLTRVNRFKDITEKWIREFEYFLTNLEGAHGRRQNAGI